MKTESLQSLTSPKYGTNMNFQRQLLKTNGFFLMFAGFTAAIVDLLSYFGGIGPWKEFLYEKSYAVAPFEAHYLALILGFLFVKHSSSIEIRFWTKVALLVEINLGISNLIWFQIFHDTNTIPMGYVATISHWLFIIGHSIILTKTRST